MRPSKPKQKPDPDKGTDRAFRIVALIGLLIIWMAYCTPFGKVPEPVSAQGYSREHG